LSSVATSAIVFACVFGSALLGIFVRSLVPETHLNSDTKNFVGLGMGLVGTLAALVLGLLVASAKNFYDTQALELTDMSAKVVLLDRILSHYGPEAQEARESLRIAVVRMLNRVWPQDGLPSSQVGPDGTASEEVYDKVQGLSPTDDTQRSLQSQALNLLIGLGATRWLMFEQSATAVPGQFVIMMTFWLAIVFLSWGLFAPSNAIARTSMFVAAFSLSGAILLILEMFTPYSGLIRISSAPLHAALTQLGH